jgi:hypothetical protein
MAPAPGTAVRVLRRALVVLAAASLACGVPLRVIRLGREGDPAPAQTGMRFRLARPVFHLDLAMEEKGHRRLVVTQSMDGPPLVFQAETDPSWLADTDITLAVDGNEFLTSASAGEKDRSQDVVEAALAVAAAAGKTAAALEALRQNPVPPEQCAGLTRLQSQLGAYDAAQSQRIDDAVKARKALEQCQASMLNCAARNAELERRQAQVQASRLRLDEWARLTLAISDPNDPGNPERRRVVEVLRADANPCFDVELEERL